MTDVSPIASAPTSPSNPRHGSNGPPVLGLPHTRIDGPAKVTGAADFPGDVSLDGVAHAALVRSPMARGRITTIDETGARAVTGVLDILTCANVGDAVRSVKHVMAGGWANSTARPLASAEILYAGQIVALVVATSPEAAGEGAARLAITYERAPHAVGLDDAGVTSRPLAELRPTHEDRRSGDVEAGVAAAFARVEADYATPVQHHNAMELPTTTCVWDGDRLTVYEPTRFVGALRHGLAAQLGIDAAKVRVVSHYIGGHFGSKLALSQHTVLAAIAARRLGRPVRLAVSRQDGFTIANHRTETRHRVRLGADREGRFAALSHTATTATSRFDLFAMEGTDVTTALYACPNIAAEERVAALDRNTPGPMRAPPEVPYLFALESAVDELAHALRLDPIELRRRNDTDRDPVTGHPFTTRPLMRCFDAGAAAFGWTDRPIEPGSRRDGEWLVGYGCAASARPVKAGPVGVRLTVHPDRALVETAHHEIGNGLYTLLAMTAADRLGLPFERITVRLGDTDLPPAGISGGSSTTTSLVNALAQACREALERRAEAEGPISVTLYYLPSGAKPEDFERLERGQMKLVTPPEGKLAWAFGAHFVEARVNVHTGEIRVARHLGAFAAGRILNPMAARSQLLGGMAWGLSSALLEATELDRASGAYVNVDLAEYLVPTSADIVAQEAITIEDDDPAVNPEGVKGLGEIGIIGANAAVANAVFNATGRRIRDLPIRLEQMI